MRSALVGTQVEGRPIQRLVVRAGLGLDHLVVDQQVHRGLTGLDLRRLCREDDVVDVQMAPAAGVFIDDLDLCRLALQRGYVPGLPVQRFTVRSGCGPHNLAAHDQVDRCRALSGIGGCTGVRMEPAADQHVHELAEMVKVGEVMVPVFASCAG